MARARYDAEVAVQELGGRGALVGSGGGGAVGRNELAGGSEQGRRGNGGDEREIAPGHFKVAEVEELVFNKAAAEAAARLVARLGRVADVGEGVARVEVLVAEEPVGGTVQIVAAAACDGVDHAARGAAELGGVAVGENLKFLHGVLGDLAADASAAGVLVVELVGRVVAVGEESVAAGGAAEGDEAEGAVGDDGGRQQHEGVHAAAVDGEVDDLRAVDDLGNVGAGGVDDGRDGLHIDLSDGAGHGEGDIDFDVLADEHLDFARGEFREALFVDGDGIAGGGHQGRGHKDARIVSCKGAADTLGGVGDDDLGSGDSGSRSVADRAGNGAQSGHRLRKHGGRAGDQAQQCEAVLSS